MAHLAAIGLHCPPHQSNGGRAMKTKLSPEELTAAKNARRVFLMVAELHKLGYEGLRICPFMSSSGCYWRCAVVPARLTRPDHGARLADDVDYYSLPRYSSADGSAYFGWANLKPKTPLALAKKFIAEFPKFAEPGHHPDPAYARWFSTMLEQTAPVGVVTAFGDWEPPLNRMIADFCKEGTVVRLPPAWDGGVTPRFFVCFMYAFRAPIWKGTQKPPSERKGTDAKRQT